MQAQTCSGIGAFGGYHQGQCRASSRRAGSCDGAEGGRTAHGCGYQRPQSVLARVGADHAGREVICLEEMGAGAPADTNSPWLEMRLHPRLPWSGHGGAGRRQHPAGLPRREMKDPAGHRRRLSALGRRVFRFSFSLSRARIRHLAGRAMCSSRKNNNNNNNNNNNP